MAKQKLFVPKGSTEEFQVVDSNVHVIVGRNVEHVITRFNAIGIDPGADNVDVTVNGTVRTIEEMGTNAALFSYGAHTRFIIGKHGSIEGTSGFDLRGDDATVVNHGTIDVRLLGNMNAGVVQNFGTLGSKASEFGLVFGDDFRLTNAEDAVIETGINDFGGGKTIFSSAEGETQIVNHGLIKGVKDTIVTWTAKDTVVNDGRIVGNILTDAGDDTLDLRGGVVKGTVNGGADDDRYIVNDTKHVLVEDVDAGTDSVVSSVTFTLTDNFDNLLLKGKADLDGTGNALANLLTGNAGKNTLMGGYGSDTLRGGLGNDRLYGGADADTFVFVRGGGFDVVMDYQPGSDDLDLSQLKGIDSFEDFYLHHVQDTENGALITSGADKILLKGIETSDISDFHVIV